MTLEIAQNDREQDETKSSESKYQSSTKRLKLNYFCICLYAFLTGTDFAVIIPTLWDRLHDDFNASGTFMGLVISSYAFTGVVSGLLMGKLSDKTRKNKVFVLISVIFAIIGHIIYFLGINKYVILSARALTGLCIGASTVALAFIARTTSVEKRTAIMSIIMASRQFGLMFGPAFNILLRKLKFQLFETFIVDRKTAPGLFMSILWSIYFFIFIFLFKESKFELIKNQSADDVLIENSVTEKVQLKETKKNTLKQFIRVEIFLLLSVTFFTYFNQTSLETMVIPFTEIMFGWSELENSLLFCCGGIMIIISFIFIRIFSKKFKDRVLILLGLCSILIGLVIACTFLPFVDKFNSASSKQLHTNHSMGYSNSTNQTFETEKSQSDGLFFGAFIFFVVFDVIGLPAIAISSASLFTKLIDNKVQGVGQGIQRGVLGIGTIVGPLCAGPFIYKPILLMSLTLVVISIIFVFFLIFFKRLIPLNETSGKEISESDQI